MPQPECFRYRDLSTFFLVGLLLPSCRRNYHLSLLSALLERPAKLSAASRYGVINGYVYLGFGGLLVVWPGAVQALLRERPFVGDEQGLFRALGLAVFVIGWLYVFGSRTRQFAAASVVDRLIFVPAVLVPLAIAGIFPHMCLAFAALDISLAVGAWLLLCRER